MKLQLFSCAAAALLAFPVAATNVTPTVSPSAEKGDPYVEISPTDAGLAVTAHNVVPRQWESTPQDESISFSAFYDIKGSYLNIDLSAMYPIHGVDSFVPKYTEAPYFDVTFTIPDFSKGEYVFKLNCDFENYTLYLMRPFDIGSETFRPSENDAVAYKPIVREGIEWVLYNSSPDATGEKFYRMQLKDVPVQDPNYDDLDGALPLFLYTAATPDFDKDPVIAYLKPAGALSAKRLPASVEIPSGFWGSNLPKQTINPFFAYEEGFANLAADGKFYWEDPFTSTRRPINAYSYTPVGKDDNDRRLLYSRLLRENEDGSGYGGEWVTEIGPVGDAYASNLPYPVYSLPEGSVPTSLLYVRDIHTDEVLWGDASLDPAYGGIGSTPSESDKISVYGSHGSITILEENGARIYNTAGALIVSTSAPATISVAPGIYIAVRGTASVKIIVR